MCYFLPQYAINQVDIDDAPRFKFRGTMIDTSRHYIAVNTILYTLSSLPLPLRRDTQAD